MFCHHHFLFSHWSAVATHHLLMKAIVSSRQNGFKMVNKCFGRSRAMDWNDCSFGEIELTNIA